MTRNFIGSATHKLDGKGRVSLPAGFRDVLRAQNPDKPAGTPDEFILIPATDGEEMHLALTPAGHEQLIATLTEVEYDSPEEEEATRLRYIGLARQISVEDGGRFVLAKDLREALGLTDAVHFVGDGGTFQLWEPGTFAGRHAPAVKAKPKKLSMRSIGQ